MAIQLNERDHLIFKYIEEHQVLLEKHIAWFISVDQKPVLIRDRLRKLFYLDYLLCQRHKNTLPWWTTPTKPLVYTLSSLTRGTIGVSEPIIDLSDADIQRHLLEVANLRMLFLIDEAEGLISELEWTTSKIESCLPGVDARVSFMRNGKYHQVAILNLSSVDTDSLMGRIESALTNEDNDLVWIVSRDDEHQQKLQKIMVSAVGNDSPINKRLAFATHQGLYRLGIVKNRWETIDQRPASMFVESLAEHGNTTVTSRAASA